MRDSVHSEYGSSTLYPDLACFVAAAVAAAAAVVAIPEPENLRVTKLWIAPLSESKHVSGVTWRAGVVHGVDGTAPEGRHSVARCEN